MRFNLRQMQCFAALAELLHFSRAAERVNMTQPAFSRQIIALEDALDVKLVERNSHDVKLTPAGKAFLSGCREAFDVLEKASRRATLIQRGFEGSIRVGYTDFAISSDLPNVLRGFRKRFPGVILEPFQASTRELLVQLEEDRLDVAFVTGPVQQEGLSAVPFTQSGLLVVLWEGHPLADEAEIKMADLAGEDFVFGIPKLWRSYLRHIDRVFADAGIEPNIVDHGFSSEGLFGLVAGQLGITLYPDCIRNYYRRGLLIREVSGLKAKIPTVAVWRDGDESNPLVNFQDFLHESLLGQTRTRNRLALAT